MNAHGYDLRAETRTQAQRFVLTARRVGFRWAALIAGATAILSGSISRADFVLTPGIERMVYVADPQSPTMKAIGLAQQAIARRDLKAAREELQKLATDPNTVHPEILLAELLTNAGFAADGRNVLEELSGQDPQRVDLYLVFGELAVRERRWFDGWNLANVGERMKPPQHWSPVFVQQVSDRLKLLKAVCCEERRDWQAAKQVYAALPQTEKNSREVLGGLGRTSFHLGDTIAALEHFTKLKDLRPETDPPQLLMAQLYDLTGKSAEAEAAYQQALKSATGTDAVRVRLAYARWLIVNNRPQDTTPLLSELIKDPPADEIERQFLQALVARMEGRLPEAQKILSALHQQNTSAFVISNQLALVLCQNTDESLRARALQIAEGNVRNLPSASEAWGTLGWVQLQLGDRGTAEKSLANAVQLGPLSRDTLHYLRSLKRAAGDTRAADLLDKAFREAKGPNYFAPPAPAK